MSFNGVFKFLAKYQLLININIVMPVDITHKVYK